jgi:hypothetical protein
VIKNRTLQKTNKGGKMRKLTEAAQVAKILKKKAKEMGLVATAKSSNFSMGNSVTIKVTEGTDANFKKFKEYSNQYQYGHFDGMTDMYEISNRIEGMAQTKYLFVDDRRFEKVIDDNLDQTQKRFYEHEFKVNGDVHTSWQWLNKFTDEHGEYWQEALKNVLQDFNAAGANSVTTQAGGWTFQMIKKKEAA